MNQCNHNNKVTMTAPEYFELHSKTVVDIEPVQTELFFKKYKLWHRCPDCGRSWYE